MIPGKIELSEAGAEQLADYLSRPHPIPLRMLIALGFGPVWRKLRDSESELGPVIEEKVVRVEAEVWR